MTRAAKTAKLIRQDLKKAFPGTKFTVHTANFAIGDCVRIEYADGPTSQDVENIVDRYQYGHYDGMEDIYVYSNPQDFPQTKYVDVQRKYLGF